MWHFMACFINYATFKLHFLRSYRRRLHVISVCENCKVCSCKVQDPVRNILLGRLEEMRFCLNISTSIHHQKWYPFVLLHLINKVIWCWIIMSSLQFGCVYSEMAWFRDWKSIEKHNVRHPNELVLRPLTFMNFAFWILLFYTLRKNISPILRWVIVSWQLHFMLCEADKQCNHQTIMSLFTLRSMRSLLQFF